MNKLSSILEIPENVPYDRRIEIIENMLRKNFTESEKESLANMVKPYFKKQTNKGKRTDLENTNVQPESVNQKIGKILGESDETVRKRQKVFENIDENTKKALDSGKKSLNSVHKQIVAAENAKKPSPPLPTNGKFNQIVEDPGWWFDNKNIGGSGESGAGFKYKTEHTITIARIPVIDIVADDAILYMWTTNQHLITGSMLVSEYYNILENNKLKQLIKKTKNQSKIEELRKEIKIKNKLCVELLGNKKVDSDTLAVMHCHGFTPKYIITWEKQEKEGWGGYGFNNVTEQLLIGIRGKVKPFGLQEKTIIKSKYKPKSHSEKPEEMWKLIEKCVVKTRWKHRKIEMNCRIPRTGWYPHGDQITDIDIKKWQKL